MSNAPERIIWINLDAVDFGDGPVLEWQAVEFYGGVKFIRADLYDQQAKQLQELEAEISRLHTTGPSEAKL